MIPYEGLPESLTNVDPWSWRELTAGTARYAPGIAPKFDIILMKVKRLESIGRYMDEPEILSRLKAHVARHQRFSPDEQRPVQPRSVGPKVDISNLSRLSAEVWTAREAVGQLNPRNPGLLNRSVQAFKKLMQRSLSWYTRSLQAFHYQVARAIEEQGTAINSVERSVRRLQDEILILKSQNKIPVMEQTHQGSKDQCSPIRREQ